MIYSLVLAGGMDITAESEEKARQMFEAWEHNSFWDGDVFGGLEIVSVVSVSEEEEILA
jgi:hypothetical protein